MSKDITPDWRDEIKIGDILRTRNDDERVVRYISMNDKRPGLIRCVGFSILRRSWTNRAYTIKNRTDLKNEGYEPTGRRYRFRAGTLDTDLMHDLRYENRFLEDQRLKAKDVIGIIR